MGDFGTSVLLGIVEGLTEFVPVSSTAHLRIVEALIRVPLADPYWKMYTIVIQLGAILCLPIYFRDRILTLFANFPRGARGDRTLLTHPLGLTALAFVFTAIPSYLLTKVIGAHLESLVVMGLALTIGGIVMWIVDAWSGRLEAAGRTTLTRSMDDMTVAQSVWIGLCQILSAVFPGTSRSMATIAAGESVRLTRACALEFSFFLSMPTMAAATGYDLLKALRPGGTDALAVPAMDTHGWLVLAVGFGVSFVVAYWSVAWLMAYVRRRGFGPFALYRLIVGPLVLAWAVGLFG
jgi:undecaprenyl-diphosphatase